jgi:hypothetical protein
MMLLALCDFIPHSAFRIPNSDFDLIFLDDQRRHIAAKQADTVGRIYSDI